MIRTNRRAAQAQWQCPGHQKAVPDDPPTTSAPLNKRQRMEATAPPPAGVVARVTPESAILFVCDIQDR